MIDTALDLPKVGCAVFQKRRRLSISQIPGVFCPKRQGFSRLQSESGFIQQETENDAGCRTLQKIA